MFAIKIYSCLQEFNCFVTKHGRQKKIALTLDPDYKINGQNQIEWEFHKISQLLQIYTC